MVIINNHITGPLAGWMRNAERAGYREENGDDPTPLALARKIVGSHEPPAHAIAPIALAWERGARRRREEVSQ